MKGVYDCMEYIGKLEIVAILSIENKNKEASFEGGDESKEEWFERYPEAKY